MAYWTYSHSVKVQDLTAQQIWQTWVDVNNWHQWQSDIEYARLDNPFQPAEIIKFRPKGGPNVKLELTEVTPFKSWSDLTRFPMAKMLDQHLILENEDGIEIKTVLNLSGPLAFLWKKIVVQEIADSLEQQTNSLIEYTRMKNKNELK